ncbi:MAG TPA: M1 family metallopeptidase, partial [Kofleriaceae bacterium]|nr:M1 family metallopeptidase [Kofleriaceae bacterium]
ALAAVIAVRSSACALSDTSTLVDDLDAADDLTAITAANASVDANARFELPSPGAPGIGDPLFPTLGNGGYEVEHYDLQLRYETADPLQPIDGTVRIIARATQSLSRFNLDFGGDSVGAVRVNGLPAEFSRDGEDLVIKPLLPLFRGQFFLITVTHFAASPKPIDPTVLITPFFVTPSGNAWALQPNNAHLVFPSNDHPSDMASFSFRIDVPEGTTAVASGVETGRLTIGGRTIYRFEQVQPMATELAQVVVGAFTVIARGEHGGVRVRDVVPTSLVSDLEPKLASEINHLDFMQALVGDYPFSTYGSLVGDAAFGFALETQTLSLYSGPSFSRPPASYEPIMVHELAHQWFGDSVAPSRWADVWANEGHATWYEYSFRFGLDSPAFISRMQSLYSFGNFYRAFFGPVANPPGGEVLTLFNPNVYGGGALVLFALRQQVGDAAFQQIERDWVSTYRGKSASTADFIALASQVSGQDLTAFLNDWFYGTTTPAMPGHPEWTVIPVPTAPSAPAVDAITSGSALHLPVDDDLGLLRR